MSLEFFDPVKMRRKDTKRAPTIEIFKNGGGQSSPSGDFGAFAKFVDQKQSILRGVVEDVFHFAHFDGERTSIFVRTVMNHRFEIDAIHERKLCKRCRNVKSTHAQTTHRGDRSQNRRFTLKQKRNS